MISPGEKIIECVPNFSEGNDPVAIQKIVEKISAVKGVKLLHVDSGKAANRTVITFAGWPEAVVEAAFQAIRSATELIDMQQHSGEHPRIGATDVCPLIPIRNISMEETVLLAKELAKKVGEELQLPVYLYEYAAQFPDRKNLANVRAGGYEKLAEKLQKPEWKPDYGPDIFPPKSGAVIIGARNILVAYNINLNTADIDIARAIAEDIREYGKITKENGNPVRTPGMFKHVRAIGWYIKEYNCAQVSLNLVNIDETPLHVVYEVVGEKAAEHGVKVTGSELIGLIPLRCLTEAGKYFLAKQHKDISVNKDELIEIAIDELGLNSLSPFEPGKRIIEYLLDEHKNADKENDL